MSLWRRFLIWFGTHCRCHGVKMRHESGWGRYYCAITNKCLGKSFG